MCGIVGVVSNRNIVPTLIDGLFHLEYRGYDSAGIAVLNNGIQRVRAVGRVNMLREKIVETQLTGDVGVGHTRWATHGGVNEQNAHPHVSRDEIAVVHNGIIENYKEQRLRLEAAGYQFTSQTDTEIIGHLVHYYSQNGVELSQAIRQAAQELKGAFAFAVISVRYPEEIFATRHGCPLLVGLGEGENFIASDVSAVVASTRKIIYLEDGDFVTLKKTAVVLYDVTGVAVSRKTHQSNVSLLSMDLGEHTHFMHKEIHEQPGALIQTMEAAINLGSASPELFGEKAAKIFEKLDGVLILAAGTSYYAGLVARYWLESIAGIPTSVEVASEYRYRASVPNPKQLVVTISQSGETLDTLEALKHAQSLGQHATLSICNVMESAIARISKLVFYTRAGLEIGVASTKAFTTQLVALFLLAITLAKQKGRLSVEQESQYLDGLRHLPVRVQQALLLEKEIARWATAFVDKRHALFLGRGMHYPIALEGALKLKEISYIHAEAYPAGELKHGPLALVDSGMPVVVTAPDNELLEKVKSNMQEVRARGGELFVLADEGCSFAEEPGVRVLFTPSFIGALSPIVHAIPVQLLAYHVALIKGTDVDKPRNLAKSVTVE